MEGQGHLEGSRSTSALTHPSCLLHSLQSIDPGQQFTWENSNLEVNKPKNRYANVIAYDHSRVILTSIDGEPRAGPSHPLLSSWLAGVTAHPAEKALESWGAPRCGGWGWGPRDKALPRPFLSAGVPGSDYINANYIDGYRKQNAYIATQGPLPETMGDFWRMVWEQRTATVVMMTRLEEKSRVRHCRALPGGRVGIATR